MKSLLVEIGQRTNPEDVGTKEGLSGKRENFR